MLNKGSAHSEIALKSDDLELLQRFLEAWCEEHHVDITDDRAAEIASSLIDWYTSGMTDRDMLKLDSFVRSPKSPRIQLLMQQLSGR